MSVRESQRHVTERDSTIDNLSHGSVQRELESRVNPDSPRTQQVMFRLGLIEEDVSFKPIETFYVKGHPEASIKLRYSRHVSRVAQNIK